jgi:hypothetical protein
MNYGVEDLKQEMLAEYEEHGHVDIQSWLVRVPDLSEELIDFAFWLEDSPREQEFVATHQVVTDDSGVAEKALRSGLHRLAEAVEEEERRLAKVLAQERQVVAQRRGGGKARPPFRRAAVQTWVFDQLRGNHERVSRFVTQKTVYLVERALNLGLFISYQKMKAGPYDPHLRYQDAEPIALKQGWLAAEGWDLVAGKNIKHVYKYAPSYLGGGQGVRDFIQFLAQMPPWDLETWTTVDTTVRELIGRKEAVTPENIRAILAASPEWKAKLSKQHFSAKRIALAIDHLTRLGLLPETSSEHC